MNLILSYQLRRLHTLLRCEKYELMWSWSSSRSLLIGQIDNILSPERDLNFQNHDHDSQHHRHFHQSYHHRHHSRHMSNICESQKYLSRLQHPLSVSSCQVDITTATFPTSITAIFTDLTNSPSPELASSSKKHHQSHPDRRCGTDHYIMEQMMTCKGTVSDRLRNGS